MYLDYLVPSWHEIESRVIAMVGLPKRWPVPHQPQ